MFALSATRILCVCFFVVLVGCAATSSREFSAPVMEGWQSSHAQSRHIVQYNDESLYAIAFRYGYDFRTLAESNHLKSPYHLKAGQVIYLSAAMGQKEKIIRPTQRQQLPATPSLLRGPYLPLRQHIEEHMEERMEEGAAVSRWNWPVQGRVIESFTLRNKGIDIAGRQGQPVLATAAGEVVYSGNGLRGYGNLIIIKHNDNYLSAYAHNHKLWVHEGQHVKALQRIADMGSSDCRLVKLHFEIRRGGRPVNPLMFLRR